jgi:hypothetical protein
MESESKIRTKQGWEWSGRHWQSPAPIASRGDLTPETTPRVLRSPKRSELRSNQHQMLAQQPDALIEKILQHVAKHSEPREMPALPDAGIHGTPSGEPRNASVPSCSSAMRDASFIASRTSCVTNTEVFPRLGPQAQKLVLQIEARHRVERAKRLVEKQNLRIGRQRARHARSAAAGHRKVPRGIGAGNRSPARLTLSRSSVTRLAMRSSVHPSRRGTNPMLRSIVK